MEHLDDNAASEFVSGALQPSALTRVEGHLAGCRDCRQLVAALAQDAGEDSNARTVPHDRLSPSQVAELPRRTLTIGDRVGRYLVLSALGSGGMGVVFSAYDPQLDRKVALKLLRSGIQLNTKDARSRLRREAQAIAQLSHPNVVGVYDVGTTDDGDLYIAMEFVEGDTLTTWLKRWPRTWREIIEVFLQAARGLEAAHSVGLLHRDFKPDNVLVGGDGRVRVTDFGLARSLIATITEESGRGATPVLPAALSSPLTATGTVLGTPRYMPPEQLTGPNIDARSDQFSFCVALHEALYGVHPLPGSTSVSMLEKGDKALPPPDGTRVPVQIGRAVARGLDADRTKRFPSIGELMSELVLPPQRSPARFVAIGLGGLLLMGVAAAAVFARKDAPTQMMPLDDRGVQPFIDQINALKDQISMIEKQRSALLRALDQRATSARDLEDLKQKLTEKDKQIQSLVEQVTVLQTRGKPVKVVPSQSALVVAAVGMAQSDIDGCLDEWVERTKVANSEGVMSTPDADLMVRLSVSPDGIGHSPVASMRTSADRSCPESEPKCFDSPSLRFCVQTAVAGVKFPIGVEQLDLEVGVAWSQGLLNLSPRVVGHHSAPGEIIDLR
jgi:serine/threonine protein kinase